MSTITFTIPNDFSLVAGTAMLTGFLTLVRNVFIFHDECLSLTAPFLLVARSSGREA